MSVRAVSLLLPFHGLQVLGVAAQPCHCLLKYVPEMLLGQQIALLFLCPHRSTHTWSKTTSQLLGVSCDPHLCNVQEPWWKGILKCREREGSLKTRISEEW